MLKKILIVAVIFLVIFSPMIVLSSCSLGIVQSIIDSNKDQPWAPDWQMRLAGTYQRTFREDQAAEAYKIFLDRYPTHLRYPEAKFNYADCLSVLKDRKDDAIKEFQEFKEWYPDNPLTPAADKKIIRLKYGPF
jgi:tetratricopeptide (TPR) repeat protein